MDRIETNDFYNDGFGWICKHCERDLQNRQADEAETARLLHEGEAESKQPEFSTLAMAKWLDPAQRILICPRCGITELADKS